MSTLNLYDVCIPLFLNTFANLTAILKKAESHDPSLDPSTARLAPDMLPLTFQIQVCSNTAKNTLVRIGKTENVPMEDNEKTFAELYARIERTVELLKSAKRDDYDGKADAEIRWKAGKGDEQSAKGLEYVNEFAVPNFMQVSSFRSVWVQPSNDQSQVSRGHDVQYLEGCGGAGRKEGLALWREELEGRGRALCDEQGGNWMCSER